MAGSLASLATAPAPNRREWPRYDAVKSFALAASVDGRLMPCTVADISLGGARLIFDDDLPATPSIELSHRDSPSVACDPVWQAGREVGVAFDFSEDSLDLISICLRNMIDLDPPPPAAEDA